MFDLLRFYAETMARPSLTPGRYFRLLLIGYFEVIEGERGIAWRAADSLALRQFLELELSEPPPDHTTISRTRRLIEVETHQAFCQTTGLDAGIPQARGKERCARVAAIRAFGAACTRALARLPENNRQFGSPTRACEHRHRAKNSPQ